MSAATAPADDAFLACPGLIRRPGRLGHEPRPRRLTARARPDPDRHQRLPAPRRRHRVVRARDGAADGPAPRSSSTRPVRQAMRPSTRRCRSRSSVTRPGSCCRRRPSPGDPCGIARDMGCGAVWFGAAAPLGLMAGALKRRTGVRRTVATTHGHEVWWAKTPGTRQLLRRIGESNDVVTYLGEYTQVADRQGLLPGSGGPNGSADPRRGHRRCSTRPWTELRYGSSTGSAIDPWCSACRGSWSARDRTSWSRRCR